MSVHRMSHWTNSQGCYFKDDPNGDLVFYDDYEKLEGEVARLTALVQAHQTYNPKQSQKEGD